MQRSNIIYVLIALWALAIAWSFWSSGSIEGPRNLDTGFKRLDVFFKAQLMAFILAIAAAIFGFVFGQEKKRLRLIGLIPIGLTVLVIAGIVFASSVFKSTHPNDTQMPTKPTAPAVDR